MILSTVSRPVKPRAMRMASMVASEPEFTKRHFGSLKFRARCSATTMESSHGSANWEPRFMRSCTASTMTGWA